MKTIEAAYIFPLIFGIIAYALITSLHIHDAVIIDTLQYGYLIKQAQSLEDDYYSKNNPFNKKEITQRINNFLLVKKDISFSCNLFDSSLYMQNLSKDNSAFVFVSNFERCNHLRKESAFLLQYLRK